MYEAVHHPQIPNNAHVRPHMHNTNKSIPWLQFSSVHNLEIKFS